MNVSVLPVNTNGSLKAVTQTLMPGNLAHQIALDPSGQYVFVPCKGSDLIAQYHFDAIAGSLQPNKPPTVAPSSNEPRHLAFHPTLPTRIS